MTTAHDGPLPRETEASLARGATIGRYVILEMVGKGGMGEVYAAYDPELDRKIAIKLLRARPGQGTNGSDARARLMREAQAIAKLSHPNVIVVYDVGTFEERVFIAMEFVDGHTVNYWMHAEPRYWVDTLKVFIAAGRGLAAAHEKQLVHRDFKPDNVMVRSDGQVRVMDFGLARLADRERDPWVAAAPPTPTTLASLAIEIGADSQDLRSTRVVNSDKSELPLTTGRLTPLEPLTLNLTRTGSMLGTPAYMAPEQFLGRTTDARTDQFSFCVALYEALYGQRPFAGDTLFGLTASVVQGTVSPPPGQTTVPGWLRKVLIRGLSVAPEDRWPTMNALLTELGRSRTVPERRRFAVGAASKLAGIWEAPVRGRQVETAAKAQMRQAFLATGKRYAAPSFENVSRILDQYAKAWAEMYADALEATHVRHEQSEEVLDLRMAFLQEALESLKALCQAFREANADVVEKAATAAGALPRIERGADIEVLRAVLKPPSDPTARAAVDALRGRLAQIRTLFNVGRISEANRAIAPIEQEARQVNYGPLLAETFLLSGTILFDRREGAAAVRAYEDAVWTAELARHDEVVAEAATQLVGVTADTGNFQASTIWCRHAEMVLKRMGGHDLLWSWFLNNRAMHHHLLGNLTAAIEDIHQAVAVKEKALGPDNWDTAMSLGNLAIYLGDVGDTDAAIRYSERALRILESQCGADHPRTAINLSNYSEFLNQVGRFDEARTAARQAMDIFEREAEPEGLFVTLAVLALGEAYLGDGMVAEAVPLIERAARNRDSSDSDPARLGEAHFALARALTATGRELPRARTLAERARAEFTQARANAITARALTRIDIFLASATVSATSAG